MSQKNNNCRVRFAPSPTGYLHVGNARGALLNYLYALKQNGTFILRIDDTDRERSREVYVDDIKHALSWLGYRWDVFERQSLRLELYKKAVEDLKRKGRLYACYETKLELEYKRKRQLAEKKPPVYDRACLRLTAAQKLAFEQEGRRPYWRFKLEHSFQEEIFTDLIRGDNKFNASSVSDPILVREDGQFLYTLSSVVDDIDLNVTHIIRGADHITNTGIQIQIFRALGVAPPAFAHFSLIKGSDGLPFSKRNNTASIAQMEERGIEPMAINNVLARLGSEEAGGQLCKKLKDLAESFDLSSFKRADVVLEENRFERANADLIGALDYEEVQERIEEISSLPQTILQPLWMCVRHNLTRVTEMEKWIRVLHSDGVRIEEADKPPVEFRQAALLCLPPEPWNESTWEEWILALSQKLGQVPGKILPRLRFLLTGEKKGPPLKQLLLLIGYKKVLKRLE